MSRQYLKSRQVASVLGVSLNTIYRWLKAGRIPEPYRNPENNYRLWTTEDIQLIRNQLAVGIEDSSRSHPS